MSNPVHMVDLDMILRADDIGTSHQIKENLFATKAEIINHLKEKEEKRVAEIKNSIRDINDLVRFMYENAVSVSAGEYTDYTARRAVQEITKEMLDIELEM